MHAGGLMQALHEFAAATTELFKVSCRFECDAPILFNNISTADHLYHIAREATANGIKLGRARNIVVSLEPREEGTVLTVTDDGIGISMPPPRKGGMGLTIMAQRAKLIGASFDIRPGARGGTVVTCTLPHSIPGSETSFETPKQRDPHYV
jgi:two-component system CheB/CheR fusion protein